MGYITNLLLLCKDINNIGYIFKILLKALMNVPYRLNIGKSQEIKHFSIKIIYALFCSKENYCIIFLN